MCQLTRLLLQDTLRMQALTALSQISLRDSYIAAGFIRNLYWDYMHNSVTPLNDVDVVFFDRSDTSKYKEKSAQKQLKNLCPAFNWQVKNQAFMHQHNGDQPYQSVNHAMSFWPEKETAIAVRLVNNGIDIISPFDYRSLYKGQITHNPKRSIATFQKRIRRKKWLECWPKLTIVC